MCSTVKIFLALVLTLPAISGAETFSFQSSGKRVALLELYTSEGCSSCPPADRWLSSLQHNDKLWDSIIPIALHVDYWDYIGWKDRFASPAYSARQQQYARENSLKTVYTPGFVLNGKEWRKWFKKRFADFPEERNSGVLKLEVSGDRANINYQPVQSRHARLEVNLALLGFDLETEVLAGENRGKKLPHNFVVLGINRRPISAKDNFYAVQMDIPATKIRASRHGIVAWINRHGSQEPLQAVGGWLP